MNGDNKEVESVALGFGPVDASFKAINNIVGVDYELADYSLRSVTEGEDALGEATVKLAGYGTSAVSYTHLVWCVSTKCSAFSPKARQKIK